MKSVDLNIISIIDENWAREMATGSFDLESFKKSVNSEIKRSKIKNKINNIFSKHDT